MGTQLRAAINKLDGVAIISGVSVNAYRGSNRDINKIRENLSVNYILDCEMAVAGKNVTAIVEFINAGNSQTVWSETYEDNVDSIFNIKSDIATKIAESVGVKVESETAKQISQKSTQNSEAFKLYTQGRTLWFTRTEADMRQSLKLYEQAIELDPDYAEPFTGIADSNSMLVPVRLCRNKRGIQQGTGSRHRGDYPQPKSAAGLRFIGVGAIRQRLETQRLGEKLPQSHRTRSQVRPGLPLAGNQPEHSGEIRGGPRILQSALKLDPNNHVILFNSALPAAELGKFEMAEKNTQLGLTVAPNYYLNWTALYRTYHRQGDKDKEMENSYSRCGADFQQGQKHLRRTRSLLLEEG